MPPVLCKNLPPGGFFTGLSCEDRVVDSGLVGTGKCAERFLCHLSSPSTPIAPRSVVF